jgi:hypothetical protein
LVEVFKGMMVKVLLINEEAIERRLPTVDKSTLFTAMINQK